jgi:hypothetical protein
MDPITLLFIGGAALIAFMASGKKATASGGKETGGRNTFYDVDPTVNVKPADKGAEFISQSGGRGTVNTPVYKGGVRLAIDRASVMNHIRNQLPGRPPQSQAGQSPQPASLRAASEINNTNALIRLDGRAEWEPLPSSIRPGALVGTFVANLLIEGIQITEVKFSFGNLSGSLRTASANLK